MDDDTIGIHPSNTQDEEDFPGELTDDLEVDSDDFDELGIGDDGDLDSLDDSPMGDEEEF